jgi:chaperone required for assembly of F1-ATPase
MPAMILTSTAIDQVLTDPTEARTTIQRFLPTGLVLFVPLTFSRPYAAPDSALFLTTDDDRILLKKQKTHFNPLIRWANKSFGLELKATQLIGGRIHHPDITTKRVKHLIEQLVSSSIFI